MAHIPLRKVQSDALGSTKGRLGRLSWRPLFLDHTSEILKLLLVADRRLVDLQPPIFDAMEAVDLQLRNRNSLGTTDTTCRMEIVGKHE